MKKYLFLATTIATASLFTGCSNNEYVGDQPEALNGTDGAIVFSMGKANTTRAIGSEAAGKLNKQFWVYGWKTVEGSVPNPQLVFKNYMVTYSDGPLSSSNTKGWEYVGITIPGASPSQTQTIKYWDYSASKYDFEAYSKTTGSVVRKDAGDYEVTQLNSPQDLYFAQKNTMSKPAGTKYGVVELTFKSVLSKIRVGFYETIPGYSVKIDGFYPPQSGESPNGFADASNTERFVAWCPNKEAKTNHPFFVTYDNEGIPAVTKAAETTDGSYYAFNDNGYTLDAQLTLGTNLRTQNQIGETSSAVTWDNIDNNKKPIYTYFIPQNQLQEGKVQPMKIKVDYTLTSTDDSQEEIHVKGATAIVPKEYVQWAPNTAYSYVFKISDNTNGSTGTPGDDPAGLYPITFDALVEDYANEGSTTTVSTPSVTAKQDGTTNGYVTTDGIVFQKGKTIDLKVMTEGGAVANPKITGGYIERDTYNYDLTPEQNLTDGGGSFDNTVALTDGTKLIAQDNTGYWVLKVATSDGSSAAFTYVIIRVGSAEVGPANRPANS